MNEELRRNTIQDRQESPPPQPLQQSLTSALLSSSPNEFRAATQHPFLRTAGEGKVTKHDLSHWLSQDRLYAETYISFVTSLIARVSLPHAHIEDKAASLRWRIVNLLTACLNNIQRELTFFTETARRYDLRLDEPWGESGSFGPSPITEQYINLFTSFHFDPQQTLLEGLVVLWATEKCYLDAWTYASIYLAQDVSPETDLDGGALRNAFIPNWSNKDFEQFVQDIADITDELAQREGALRKVEVFKALWLHVLNIEKGFWPELGND
ncbi:hypothetical protein LTS08_007468 [Lithohypha guttulata]|nr:hypothetical protein LTS08_007468 [Lithohypha guttulata]